MTSYSSVDDLESQRRELVARRAMLEERFELRLATAQEFGVIHTHRLGRVREAFALQCGAARRRNQGILDKVHQSKESLLDEKAVSVLSRKRLSHQTDRFLSVADKLCPAWQEEQLHRKARQLGAMEEERFVTQQRRKAARDRFEQEQALAVVFAERRRELAAARAHERNELVLRQVQRDRSTADSDDALKAALQRVNEAARTTRHDMLVEVTNRHDHRHRSRRHDGDQAVRKKQGSSDSDDVVVGGDGGGRGGSDRSRSGERCYIASDDDADGQHESSMAEIADEGEVWYDTNSSRRGTVAAVQEGVSAVERSGSYSGRSNEKRMEDEGVEQEEAGVWGRPSLKEGSGAGRDGGVAQRDLPGVFCATRARTSTAAARTGGHSAKKPGRQRDKEATERNGNEHAEAVGSELHALSLAAGDSGSGGTPTVEMSKRGKLGVEQWRSVEQQKPRGGRRRRHRRRHHHHHHRSDDEESRDSSSPVPPSLPLADVRGGGSTGSNDSAKDARGRAVKSRAKHSQEKDNTVEKKEDNEVDLPVPPTKETSARSRRRRSNNTRSFSSSDGFSDVMFSSGSASGSACPAEKGKDPPEVTLGIRGARGVKGARHSIWSEEDDNAGCEAGTRLGDMAVEGPPARVGGGVRHDGSVGEGEYWAPAAAEESRPKATTTPAGNKSRDPESRQLISLSVAARAINALTAQIERLAAQQSAAAAATLQHREVSWSAPSRESPSSLILGAYGSAAAERSEDAEPEESATKVLAAAAAVAVAVLPADDSAPASSKLEEFEMPVLCGAVLDLVTAHATAVLPAEALSGIITAAKVRAHHRRGGNAHPGRIQLFDSVTTHARRLCVATAAPGGGSDGERADSATIAGIFEPCFKSVFAARTPGNDSRNGVGGATVNERLRRKVFSFLRSAADPSGEAITGTIASHVFAGAAMAVTPHQGRRTGGDRHKMSTDDPRETPRSRGKEATSGGDCGAIETTVSPQADSREPQQREWGATRPLRGTNSDGVVLGRGRDASSRTKRKGGRLDLSSLAASMADISAAGYGGGLPEFENDETLEE